MSTSFGKPEIPFALEIKSERPKSAAEIQLLKDSMVIAAGIIILLFVTIKMPEMLGEVFFEMQQHYQMLVMFAAFCILFAVSLNLIKKQK